MNKMLSFYKRDIQFMLQHYGSETEPLPVKDIALFARVKEQGSCPATRRLIRELIKEGTPIGSNGKGYFLLRTKQQLQVYLNSLMQRQVRIAERISDTFYAFERRTKQ